MVKDRSREKLAKTDAATTFARMPLKISQGPQFDAIGRCIYCDATQYDPNEPERRLGNEHIIPKSLGGTSTLPRASCKECEDVTKAFEQRAARGIFQHVRLKLDMKMSERPKALKAVKDWDPESGRPNEILIATDDHPGVLLLASLQLPTILTDGYPNSDIPAGHWYRIFDSRNERPAFNKPTQFYHEIEVNDQARLLAKIAFCYAVGCIGLNGFDTEPMRDVICNTANWPRLVGGTLPFKSELAKHYKSTRLHDINLYSESIGGQAWAAAQVRLFALYNTPIFTVILGRLTADGMERL